MEFQYEFGVLGGTFDHLHIGHRAFLQFALQITHKLVIGLADGPLLRKKEFREQLQSFEVRKRALQKLFQELGCTDDVLITPLLDPCGISASDRSLQVIFVTPITKSGEKIVNKKRAEKKLPSLVCEVAEMVLDNNGEYISSTRVRAGEIARDGFVYASLLQHDIQISTKQHAELQKSWGKIFHEKKENTKRVLIGDSTTQYFVEQHLPFSFAYIDGMTQREKVLKQVPAIETKITQVAGSINKKVARHIQKAIQQKTSQKIYKIDGEEDLCVVPAVLLSPLGTEVIYGDPHTKTLRIIKITEEKKEQLRKLFSNKT